MFNNLRIVNRMKLGNIELVESDNTKILTSKFTTDINIEGNSLLLKNGAIIYNGMHTLLPLLTDNFSSTFMGVTDTGTGDSYMEDIKLIPLNIKTIMYDQFEDLFDTLEVSISDANDFTGYMYEVWKDYVNSDNYIPELLEPDQHFIYKMILLLIDMFEGNVVLPEYLSNISYKCITSSLDSGIFFDYTSIKLLERLNLLLSTIKNNKYYRDLDMKIDMSSYNFNGNLELTMIDLLKDCKIVSDVYKILLNDSILPNKTISKFINLLDSTLLSVNEYVEHAKSLGHSSGPITNADWI